MNDRVLVAGSLLGPPMPATRQGAQGLREFQIDVPTASGSQIWSVLLMTAEADAEVEGLDEGAIVACVGSASIARFPLDPLARLLTAERVLTLRDRPVASRAAESVPTTTEACALLVDKLIATAREDGVARERARIAAIMNSPCACGNMLIAWRLAEHGAVTREAADEALMISSIARLKPAVGASGSVLEN